MLLHIIASNFFYTVAYFTAGICFCQQIITIVNFVNVLYLMAFYLYFLFLGNVYTHNDEQYRRQSCLL